jgi:hypothetical protein
MGIGEETGIRSETTAMAQGASVARRSYRGKGGAIADRDERKPKGPGNWRGSEGRWKGRMVNGREGDVIHRS